MATGNEEAATSPEMLARDAQRMQAFSQHLKARVLEVAEALARTEESVATTMAWLATSHPERAEWLKAMSESARKQAAEARRWGKEGSRLADGPARRHAANQARDSRPGWHVSADGDSKPGPT
jgi:hypothetical protein